MILFLYIMWHSTTTGKQRHAVRTSPCQHGSYNGWGNHLDFAGWLERLAFERVACEKGRACRDTAKGYD
ncbi:hypothetical protein KSD_25950 [Ktedonobacter sp. SOSP1-85]|nr:hypothetical protein KSD_25950 [Ktedonobacter sp. SOSP1-85]